MKKVAEKFRELFLNGDWDGYEEDLSFITWTPTRDPLVVVAVASIGSYHGEGIGGGTITATAKHDRECGSMSVVIRAGEEYGGVVELSAPTVSTMLGLLKVLSSYQSSGGSQWEWCAPAWLAHQLVSAAEVTA